MIEKEGVKYNFKYIGPHKEIKVIELGGYIDQANVYLLQQLIDESLKEGCVNIIFDFQDLIYMSSAGWGVIVGEIKRFREQGGDIKIANMAPDIYEIYQMLEFYHIISEYPSVDEALSSFSSVVKLQPEDKIKMEGTFEELTEILSEEEGVNIAVEPVNNHSGEEFEVEIGDFEISELSPQKASSNKVKEFRPILREEKIDLAKLPLPEKVKKIVAENPFVGVWQMKKILKEDRFGNVKIGYFKLRKLLKDLELDTKEKRYRYFRSC